MSEPKIFYLSKVSSQYNNQGETVVNLQKLKDLRPTALPELTSRGLSTAMWEMPGVLEWKNWLKYTRGYSKKMKYTQIWITGEDVSVVSPDDLKMILAHTKKVNQRRKKTQ